MWEYPLTQEVYRENWTHFTIKRRIKGKPEWKIANLWNLKLKNEINWNGQSVTITRDRQLLGIEKGCFLVFGCKENILICINLQGN